MIKNIIISKSARDDKVTSKIVNFYSEAKVQLIEQDRIEGRIVEGDPKNNLFLTHSKGDVIRACPGTSGQYLCCRYQIINQTLNCPFNCTYCILQYYLNQSATIIYTDFNKILNNLDKALFEYGNRFIRIGTGELGDSLALFGSRLFAKEAVEFFASKNNILFELKSKSNQIEPLLDLKPNKRTVVSWSLNPPEIILQEELGTNSLDERLDAAKSLENQGYLLGFHFDPVIKVKNWQKRYGDLIEKLYTKINPDNIAWISIGSLRFPPSTKDQIIKHYPHTRIIYEEMIKGLDGKMRYPRPLRAQIYKFIYKKLKDIYNPPFIYFCMENKTVWQEVMGFSPDNNAYLDWMFADSIYKRFKGIVSQKPNIQNFENALNIDGSEF
ncbi:MAG: DNA photolyase [Candidatus Cloacimonetes bacterium]|nr:DNA photolyase [Candidatus Cloacimonadota bacterium]MBS3766710.1 DNA photolyase [Candidatus Cloacimonadota bacterium]